MSIFLYLLIAVIQIILLSLWISHKARLAEDAKNESLNNYISELTRKTHEVK